MCRLPIHSIASVRSGYHQSDLGTNPDIPVLRPTESVSRSASDTGCITKRSTRVADHGILKWMLARGNRVSLDVNGSGWSDDRCADQRTAPRAIDRMTWGQKDTQTYRCADSLTQTKPRLGTGLVLTEKKSQFLFGNYLTSLPDSV
jgi:hypothetical protein